MIQKLKAFWSSLPHPVQALVLSVATAMGTAVLHAASESFCFDTVCLKHYIGVSVAAGLAAARAFYMVPNRGANGSSNPQLPPVAPPAQS